MVGFGVLALNAVKPVFPGMASTPSLLLALVAPLSVLFVLMIWGLPITVRSDHSPLILALLVAPLTFIGLGGAVLVLLIGHALLSGSEPRGGAMSGD